MNRAGFSLVELSIVLVILGLLTGGILSGQHLIRAAELRTIGIDFNRYATAMMTFKGKYFALPGDMPNATRFWGAEDNDPDTCGTTASTGKETCNGNGDGNIHPRNPVINIYSSEMFRFWQHLSNANLIPGAGYTGVNGPNNTFSWDAHIGENVPEASISGTGFSVAQAFTPPPRSSGYIGYYEMSYPIRVLYGTDSSFGMTEAPALTGEEAFQIDTKLDDGRPGFGKIMGRHSDNGIDPGGTTSVNREDAEWNVADGSIICALLFLIR